jgi:hypothetical protein
MMRRNTFFIEAASPPQSGDFAVVVIALALALLTFFDHDYEHEHDYEEVVAYRGFPSSSKSVFTSATANRKSNVPEL